MDLLSNKYIILLILVLCLYFTYTTFESVEEQKNNISVSIIQVVPSNKTENIHEPLFNLTPVEIDSNIPNPFLSSWLREKAIEEKKRLEAEAEAKKIADAKRLEEERKRKAKEERLAQEKEAARLKAEEEKKLQAQNQPNNNVAEQPKTNPKPKQNKQFRYIGHTLVNGQELILIEVLENKKIHYITKDETIETYKVNSFDKEKLELIKDDKIYVIKRGNIILLET
jgi:hypothetical protein